MLLSIDRLRSKDKTRSGRTNSGIAPDGHDRGSQGVPCCIFGPVRVAVSEMSAVQQSEIVHSFKICLQARVLGYSHSSSCIDPSGGRRITSWLEFFDDPPLGLRRYRRKSMLRTDLDGHPLALDGCDSRGNKYSLTKAAFLDMEIVLEANMIGQLAEAIRIRSGRLAAGFLTIPSFLADGGRCFDLKLNRMGAQWQSNLKETLILSEHGRLDWLETSTPGIYFGRIVPHLPDWTPDIGSPTGYRSREGIRLDEIEIGAACLKGTVVAPEGPAFATAVFLGGSGRYDRHGLSGDLNLGYGAILDGLAQRGLRSLRYERYKTQEELPNLRTFIDGAKDAWSTMEPRKDGAQARILLGHSLGGLIALMAAQELHDVSGIVLIAAPGRPINAIIEDQIDWMLTNGGYTAEQAEAVRSKRTLLGETIRQGGPPPDELFGLEDRLDYLRDLSRIEPAKLAASIDCPLLIFHCENDVQVSRVDAELLALGGSKGRPRKLVTLEGVNHILQTAPRNERDAIWHYGERQVDEGTLDAIADHIKRFITKAS